jgi:hypothetical protein
MPSAQDKEARLCQMAMDFLQPLVHANVTTPAGEGRPLRSVDHVPDVRIPVFTLRKEGVSMSIAAKYTRLYADAHGISRFEDQTTGLAPRFAVPPAEPLHVAPFLLPEGATFWVGGPPDWQGDAMHPAPRRMIFITVQGEYEVTTGDGDVRRFPAGGVLLVEDTTGTGHSTRFTSEDEVTVFAVGLPPK